MGNLDRDSKQREEAKNADNPSMSPSSELQRHSQSHSDSGEEGRDDLNRSSKSNPSTWSATLTSWTKPTNRGTTWESWTWTGAPKLKEARLESLQEGYKRSIQAEARQQGQGRHTLGQRSGRSKTSTSGDDPDASQDSMPPLSVPVRPPNEFSMIQTIQIGGAVAAKHELLILNSPISLGPQRSPSPTSRSVASPCPATPAWNNLPKYMPAFEYAMLQYLDTHFEIEHAIELPQTPAASSSAASMPFIPPRRKSEISYTSGSDSDLPELSYPTGLLNTHGNRLKLIHLRTLLTRCLVLQKSVHALIFRPALAQKDKGVHWHYSRMLHLTTKAKVLAESLECNDMRARYHYWAGRACGGTRDWDPAVYHFDQAMMLDVPDEVDERGRIWSRGLKKNEKYDVERLSQAVKERRDRHNGKMEEAKREAKAQAADDADDQSISILQDLIDWDEIDGEDADKWDWLEDSMGMLVPSIGDPSLGI